MKTLSIHLLYFLVLLQVAFAQRADRPNIVLILADDMGYSDLGCFGSEIHTPYLDSMAQGGVKMTNFYNASRCCPSRASLLTGVYPHQAGIGDMMNTRPYPAYQGYLNRETVTLAEVLGSAGYGTYMTGKWHVGQAQEHWPLQRGFDQFYGLIDGANSYFENRPYRPNQKLTIALGNEEIMPPQDYYSTDAYTDYAISFVDQHLREKKSDPFFLYIAYQAPHWPLHAKPEDIARYQGKYMDGWEAVRQRRFEKQQALGLFPPSATLSPLDTTIGDWQSLSWEEKVRWDERMSVYAAMVDAIDQNVGRLVEHLRKNGQLENTIFLFLSDNGASNETITNQGFTEEIRAANFFPASHPKSFTAYGKEGAVVSNTPFRKFKHWEFEGGNATGFIAYGPNYIPKGLQIDQPAHLIDIMPSVVEWADAAYPNELAEHAIQPMEGKALQAIWDNELVKENRAICFEHEGNKAVRKGEWKLVAEYPENVWYLYNLETDRTENIDVKEKYPEVVKELSQVYDAWAKRVGVIPYQELDKKRGNVRYQ
ncbi:arylsulfatase [Sphingobacterium chuzhouense]|uniref:Arylsulfatase n=1 Tax=Sphingobacterium chuzhouense TaxID=1742264 RepID=A0ABR7XMU2_9SPHI|nr:arylsulfatase [Sphingobacterium chuzhouense]MBD1420493.1 arylsulfatase [Sphingobacterium chuzhouense]